MKENKGRFWWRNWAKFETIDKDGQVWQFSEMPVFDQVDQTWDLHNAAFNLNGNCEKVGRSHPPEDAYKTVIERYPSSQPAPAPETDYEETPFVPNRAEVWARFMAALIAGETVTSAANIADQALAEYDKRFLNQ